MTERELLIVDPAAQMKNLRPVKQLRRELSLQRSANVVLVLRLIGIGQPYGNKKQLLPILQGKALKGFRKAQDAAGIQATQIDDRFSV